MNCSSNSSSSSLNATEGITYGWVQQPNGRGTLDILISCLLTFFLCGWSCICPNVPAPGYLKWDLIRDKWHLFCLAMLGPEFVFLLALGQYMKARESVTDFHKLGFEEWTLKHGFFANMGGFVLQPVGWKQFPITSKQLKYLIENGYVDYPSINQTFIKDKNKADGLTRIITLCQIAWFLVNAIARAQQGLKITSLELTTIAFIFCTFGTAFCWNHKPMDVEDPLILETTATIDRILIDAGPKAREPYRQTPLDFIDREEWVVSACWVYCVNLLRGFGVVNQRPRVRPVQRISSFDFPKLSVHMLVAVCVLTAAYCAIFLVAWNSYFPTKTERLLWRLASGVQLGVSVMAAIIEVVLYAMAKVESPNTLLKRSTPLVREDMLPVTNLDTLKKNQSDTQPRRSPLVVRINQFLGHISNNDPGRDPMLTIALHTLLITTPACAVYCICRAYILVEDLVGLRSMPASAFQSIEWINYWPHF